MSQPHDGAAEKLIAGRYAVHELLGRGGMAHVYRVSDPSGREFALKQLLPSERERSGIVTLFEREFHTLTQLRHPCVISVHDYGISERGPYYTMELLDGGDLRARAPLPWRECCALFFDVCSSLALLHSRRLLHHDISPRNIRCTRDGKAKLIDFGAIVPMGVGGGRIVGTPGFTAPETVQRSALDARADLFSLGATLYYALTRQMAYPARTFAEALEAWNTPPVPPSARVADIPPALDELVLTLLSVEPASRLHSAFEVMQRLAAIAGLPCDESEQVSRAYLTTPVLVGREQALAALREHTLRALAGHGGGVLVEAAPGMGRSRMLDSSALVAKTLGATVLRATAGGAHKDFAVALDLLRHLLEALPPDGFGESSPDPNGREPTVRTLLGSSPRDALARLAELESDPERLQRVACRLMLSASRRTPLVIAVDDVHRVDEPSAAVLASLVDAASRERLLLLLTAPDEAAGSGRALAALAERCAKLTLTPLSAPETRALLASVFGDVAHLEGLAGEIHAIARGNPRQALDLAQHLVDRRIVRYAGGAWTLPAALSVGDLPRSAEEALRARIATFSPHARFLAQAHALAFYELLSHADYHALCPEVDAATTERAIAELLEHGALVGDAHGYALTNRLWTAALIASLTDDERRERHRALVHLYAPLSTPAIHHIFASGQGELGLAAFAERHKTFTGADLTSILEPGLERLGSAFIQAIETATALGRSPREIHELRRWCTALSAACNESSYWFVAPAWLERLKVDSGWYHFHADSQNPDPGARLGQALQRAAAAHQAAPEAERVYRVDEAIPLLAEYVACSIAVGSRTVDIPLLASLPPLLEPFVPLSPLLHAIWQNAIATIECTRDIRYEQARERWIAVIQALENAQGNEIQHVRQIRDAVAYGIGMIEASLGLPSATRWADVIDHNPVQRLGAISIRKIARLEQGDWSGAERLRREAELTALRSRIPKMFHFTLTIELAVYAHARDLVGMQHAIEQIADLAERCPGWIPYLREAQARFQLVRGDYAAAKAGFEACLEMTALDDQLRSPLLAVWMTAQTGVVESLLGLGAAEEARDRGRAALAICEQLAIGAQSNELVRAVALAEAKLGEFESARARVEQLIERQLALGASGLRLGLSYETLARIAIWSDDGAGFDHYAKLAAREYRYGARSPVAARYEALIHEARRRGIEPAIDQVELDVATMVETTAAAPSSMHSAVSAMLGGGALPEAELRQRALRLLCDACHAGGGHLYLVGADGVVLVASHALPPPPAELTEQVQAFVSGGPDHVPLPGSAIVTLSAYSARASTIMSAGAATYELAPLARVVDCSEDVIGVAALAISSRGTRLKLEPRLLSAVANYLSHRHTKN